LGVFYA